MSKPYNERYLSKRPFLVICTTYMPGPDIDTRKANWGSDKENWQRNEIPLIVDRVSDKLLQEADIVLDIMEQRCVKNRNDISPTQITAHYLNKYGDDIQKAVRKWAKTSASVREWIKKQAEERTEEIFAEAQAAVAEQDSNSGE